MNDFLGKPFTLEQLQRKLAQWLPPASIAEAAGDANAGVQAGEVIDPQVLDALRDLDPQGGDVLLTRVLRMFLQSAGESLERIDGSIERGDAEQLSRVAHAMKSIAANVGAHSLAALHRELEMLGREARIEEAQRLREPIRREGDRAVARVRKILEEAL